jgi:hypothetical protein
METRLYFPELRLNERREIRSSGERRVMTKARIEHIQTEINAFIKRNPSLGYTKLRVDGVWGRLSKQIVREIKYELGYSRKRMTPQVGNPFLHRMRHPTWVEPKWRQTKLAVKNGKKRRRKRRAAVRRLKIHAFFKPGVGTFDGKPVAKCAIPILQWCRANGWDGSLVSGWRSAVYSISLCIRMCGRSSCPGKCAGAATNHTGISPSRFAMDVSDYLKFARVVAKCPIQPHVHNSLPRDLVHFSPSGN